MVALMIVPLPTWLLDLLIASNLSLSVAILLVVLYAPDAIRLAAFPTVLLLTTLFRLSLNVSSTRLILLQAHAGEVIRAFGEFVVRRNYVVGGIVFLILTIIQFVVIAKGSERVAEVGARFVLDAMPGRQMAIDAELRAGNIDGREAQRRREGLTRESQFYGAMDGAMKFVKGDVIAAIIIAVINILGGLAIGVGQRGLSVTDALKRYGLLTIGDGLVSQIPALVLSTAAGILVTRTASEEEDTALGSELWRQLFSGARSLRVAGAFVVVLGLVPGLPAVPFLVMGGLLLAASERARRETPAHKPLAHTIAPWAVEVGAGIAATPEAMASLSSALDRVRRDLQDDLGVVVPAPVLKRNGSLGSEHVAILLREIPARQIHVPNAVHSEGFVCDQVRLTLRSRAADFVGIAETQRMLDELETEAPALVRAVTPKHLTVVAVAEVLRRLVEEGVSIRDLRVILEGLALMAPTEKDPVQLAEYTRSVLRRAITHRLTRGSPYVAVVVLDPSIEDTVRHRMTRDARGPALAMPPTEARDLVTSIARALHEGAPGLPSPVVLTQPDIRRFVRKLLETDRPDVFVTSHAELDAQVTVRPVARAHLAGLG